VLMLLLLLLLLMLAVLVLQIDAVIHSNGSGGCCHAYAARSGNLSTVGRLHLASSNAGISGLWPVGRNVLRRRHSGRIEVDVTWGIVRSIVRRS